MRTASDELPELDVVTDASGAISIVPSPPPEPPTPPVQPPPLPSARTTALVLAPKPPSKGVPPPVPLQALLEDKSPRTIALLQLVEELRRIPAEGRRALVDTIRVGDAYGFPTALLEALERFANET